MSKITKVIFDNDGVNIDSEHIAMGDMDEFGYDLVHQYIDPETSGLKESDIYVEYKGVSSNEITKKLIEKYNLPEDAIRTDYNIPEGVDLYEFLSDLHTKSVISKFESGKLETLPHVKETLQAMCDELGEGNMALCTTSRGDRMDATVHAIDPDTKENIGWGDTFPSDERNLRISGYGHANKYEYFRELHPDWDPETTAVVEDTAGSTKKSIDAGFTNVIGIVASKFQTLDDEGYFSRDKQLAEIAKLKEASARVIVTDYRDIPAAIEWMDNGMSMDNVPSFHGEVHHNNPLEADRRVTKATPGAHGPN